MQVAGNEHRKDTRYSKGIKDNKYYQLQAEKKKYDLPVEIS